MRTCRLVVAVVLVGRGETLLVLVLGPLVFARRGRLLGMLEWGLCWAKGIIAPFLRETETVLCLLRVFDLMFHR